MTTLLDAKAGWRKTIHGKGGNCPCCERFGKVYARALNKTMVESLKWLADQNTAKGLREWIDVPNTAPKAVLRSNQLASLRWWGLVERQLPDPGDKKAKHSGMWRVTLRGMDFVEGRLLVPKKVSTYNGEVVSTSDEMVSITSLFPGFNYSAVMVQHHATLEDSLIQKGVST